jgi:hypothetical protein
MTRITELVPHWLAWPLNLLSTAAAIAGAGFLFYGAAFGDGEVRHFLWGAVCFTGAAVVWWVADLASSNRPL